MKTIINELINNKSKISKNNNKKTQISFVIVVTHFHKYLTRY